MFHFSSCIIKILLEPIFEPKHQSTSKDFNQIGEKIVEEGDQNYDFCLDCDLSSRLWKNNTRRIVCQNRRIFKLQKSIIYK